MTGLFADNAWEAKARKTPAGMADISGGALPGITCFQCRYFRMTGHYATKSKHHGKAKPGSCSKYQSLMHLPKPGPKFSATSHACKHFEQTDEKRALFQKAYDD